MAGEIINRLYKAVMEYDADAAEKLAREALEKGVDPLRAVNEGLVRGIDELGRLFEEEKAFLPELLLAADAYRVAMNVLKPKIMETKPEAAKPIGVVVIGTVFGDIHDIGKNLVATMLEANGFEVHDLGKDVPIEKFVEATKKYNADFVASSALTTVTRDFQRVIERALRQAGIREKVKTCVGGAPVSAEWAEEIGADGYAPSASTAVDVFKKLIGVK